MLKGLPVHVRQSLYRCLDVTSEPWIESEPELTWAKYTPFLIEIIEIGRETLVRIFVSGERHSLFDIPADTWTDESAVWYCLGFPFRHGNIHTITIDWYGGLYLRSESDSLHLSRLEEDTVTIYGFGPRSYADLALVTKSKFGIDLSDRVRRMFAYYASH